MSIIDEIDELLKFFEFFEIPLSSDLHSAIEAVKAESSEKTRRTLKMVLGRTILSDEHPVFKDEIFEELKPEIVTTLQELEAEEANVEE